MDSTGLSRADLERIIRASLAAVIEQHGELARRGVQERSITTKLAAELERHVSPPLHVDHEYNRHKEDVKRLPKHHFEPASDGQRMIQPDIVIHERGHDDHNVLAMEVKKDARCCDCDLAKITGLIENYKYRHGLLLALGISTSADNLWNPRWKWISPPVSADYEPVFDPDRLAGLHR